MIKKHGHSNKTTLDTEKILIQKAFVNTVSILDQHHENNCVAVIDEHWESHYIEEANYRNIKIEIIDCTK